MQQPGQQLGTMDDFAVALAPLLALVSAYSSWLELTVVFGFALAPGTYHLVLPVMHVVSGGIMPIGAYLLVLPVIIAVFGGTLAIGAYIPVLVAATVGVYPPPPPIVIYSNV